MTTLISWISVDDRGPSAIYVGSDSRITWGSPEKSWDSGRKVFAAGPPEVFGYVGDVLFPSLVLGQLTDMIDKNLLWNDDTNSGDRHARVVDYLKRSMAREHRMPSSDFSILHATKEGTGLDSAFYLWQIGYTAINRSWTDALIADASGLKSSQLLVALGTGAPAFDVEAQRWLRAPQGQVSRAYFSAFCDAIKKGDDKLSGGEPQLVSIDRKSGGKVLGYVSGVSRYLYGLPVDYTEGLDKIEWVDEKFQRINPATLDLLSGAQRHGPASPSPKSGFSEFVKRTQRE